jgi:ferritin-like metal-binding protein YciE
MAELRDQLTKYLTDAYSIEQQALAQLRTAPDLVGDPELARIFSEHLVETQDQEERIGLLLEKRGASPSRLKDMVMAAGGKAFVLFARSQPDTTGKLTAHAHSYEALEEASYEMLLGVAERAGEEEVAGAARLIRDQETQMRERLAGAFDAAAEQALREVDPDDLDEQLTKYLADAHAIEAQAIQLLQRGPKIGGVPELEQLYARHLEQSRDQQRRVEERLDALGGSPNRLQDAAMRLGALNWGAFFQAQPDTPGKLATFAYAFEHLEIGGYELLKRVAAKAGDQDTVAMADSIIVEERAMAGSVQALFGKALDASLEAQGVAGSAG